MSTARTAMKGYPTDKSAYLVCGDDEYRVATAAAELIDALVPESDRAFGLDRIDGRVGTVDETVATIRAVRDALVADGLFGGGDKTVWFREPSFLSSDKIAKSERVKTEVQSIAERIKDGLPEGTRLIVSTQKINRASTFFKAFSGKDALVIDFGSALKARQRADAAAELADEEARRIGLSIPPDAMRLFLSRVGTDSRRIVSELAKLAAYCGEGAAATADDVREIVSTGATSEIWDFTDAFATRNKTLLVRQIRTQLAQGENAIRLVNSLLTCVGDLLAIREGIDKKWATPGGGGLDWSALPEEIADGLGGERNTLGGVGFQLRKKIDQASAWTLRDLRNARHYILQLREALVSCSLPEECLMEAKLLQAIGVAPAKR